MEGLKMNREIYINLDEYLDLVECIQDATTDKTVIQTIDEVIDIAYEVAKG